MRTVWINLYQGPALVVPGSYTYKSEQQARYAAVEMEQKLIRHPYVGAFPVEIPDRAKPAAALERVASFIRHSIENRVTWASSPEGVNMLGPGSPNVPGLQEYYGILNFVEQLQREGTEDA